MSFKLTILGSHSATPRVDAAPTAQVLEIKNHTFLIDCGEGTQIQLRKFKISFAKINHIFISHLHGDHFFGLIGMLSSFGLLSRTKTMYIYAPVGLKAIIELQLQVSETKIGFPIEFHELTDSKSLLIFEDKNVEVYTIPLTHRIYTNGFLFKEKPDLHNLCMERILQYPEIQRCDYFNLKKGKDFVQSDGSVIANEILTLPPKKPLQYAFCSDTSYQPRIIPLIKNVDLLYHEATFTSKDEELAIKTGHATARQAAQIAKKAKVGKLIIGHFSNRYRGFHDHLMEARKVFENTELASDGGTIIVN
ncbi:MAG: ribonuclease Z [Flavobacteriaceae bacterium]|nr:ribonuclease Z [Flavobacteriaceae bacterium]